MSDTVASATDPAPGPRGRSRWSSTLRIAVEFALLFAVAAGARQLLIAASPGSYPNPLWLPVIVLSLQHGLAAGLAAAVIAACLQYWNGLPPPLMTEDMYGYIGRVAAEPVGWTCVALLLGHIRSRQLAHIAELEAELAERNRHCTAVADLCVDLRARTETLERQIAADAHSSSADVAEAITELQHATWDDFAPRLTRFVAVMTGAAEFSIYLLRDNALRVAFQSDEHVRAADVPSDDPLFAAIVNERRILSTARPGDLALLGNRAILAGPLLDGHASERVIGMFAIGGALDGRSQDIERRLALACSQISRLAGRVALIDRWRAAAPPSRANGHEPAHAVPPVEHESSGRQADVPSSREIALQ